MPGATRRMSFFRSGLFFADVLNIYKGRNSECSVKLAVKADAHKGAH